MWMPEHPHLLEDANDRRRVSSFHVALIRATQASAWENGRALDLEIDGSIR